MGTTMVSPDENAALKPTEATDEGRRLEVDAATCGWDLEFVAMLIDLVDSTRGRTLH
jgi:hypothetical protein